MKSLFYPVLLLFHAVFISLGNDSKMIKIHLCGFTHGIPFSQKKVYFTAQVSNGEPSLTFYLAELCFSHRSIC